MQVGKAVNQLVQRNLFKRGSAKQGLIMPEWLDQSICLNTDIDIRRKKDLKIGESFPRHYVPKTEPYDRSRQYFFKQLRNHKKFDEVWQVLVFYCPFKA